MLGIRRGETFKVRRRVRRGPDVGVERRIRRTEGRISEMVIRKERDIIRNILDGFDL